MLIPNQKVKVRWNSANKKHYESKGYPYTKMNDELEVLVVDLTKAATNIVNFVCDYCNEIFTRSWKSSNRSMNKTKKHACSKCRERKIVETYSLRTEKTERQLQNIERMRPSFELIENEFTNKNYTLTSNKYLNNNSDLNFICNIHEDIGEQVTSLNRLRSVKHNCLKCREVEEKESLHNNINSLDYLKLYKQLLNNEIDMLPKGFVEYLEKEKVADIIRYAINIECEIKNLKVDEDYTIFTTTFIDKYKLTSFQVKYGIFELYDITYPNKIKRWQLTTSQNFWNKDTVREAGTWLIEKLIEDNVIDNVDDIPNIKNQRKYFNKYKLDSMISSYFNSRNYDFWNFMFPDKWFPWEFNFTTRYYWENKENRLLSLKQLIENKLMVEIKDIPDKITYPFLVKNYRKFAAICDIYYNSRLFDWVNDCYPDQFKIEDFYNNIAKDGTVLDSIIERKIHDYLCDNLFNITYFDNKQDAKETWKNDKHGEWYVPDWVLNNNVIVEYFGWYNEKLYGKYELINKYMDKANRKIQYYSNLDEYRFIALYPEDVENDLEGVKIKLKPIIDKSLKPSLNSKHQLT